MAFVPEAALIALREGLEALLITGILLSLVTRLGRKDARKHVWAGFLLAAAASIAAGWAIQRYLLDTFEARGGGEWFELVAALAAVLVLTYMVFWMWKHTRALMTTLREHVGSLLTRGALLSIVVLTFASVIREGLEVVLFYSALATRHAPLDLALSGLVGLAASALLVALILGGSAKLDLQRFFGVTGILLVFVAAGLLVHSVSAATALGLLDPAPSLWDTSAVLPDDSATGRILHALVGYAATPTFLQALLYFGYVFGIGGAYLWSLGAFHRRDSTRGRVLVPPRAVAALAALVLVGYAVGMGAAHPGALVEGHDHADASGDDHADGETHTGSDEGHAHEEALEETPFTLGPAPGTTSTVLALDVADDAAVELTLTFTQGASVDFAATGLPGCEVRIPGPANLGGTTRTATCSPGAGHYTLTLSHANGQLSGTAHAR